MFGNVTVSCLTTLRKKTGTCKDFVRAHRLVELAASDCFTTEDRTVSGLVTYYVFVCHAAWRRAASTLQA